MILLLRLLRLLWGATEEDFNTVRRTFKLTVLMFIIDAAGLMAALIGIALYRQTLADPWISGIGLLWMAFTAFVVFIFAGPWIDTAGFLDLLSPGKKEPSKESQKERFETPKQAGAAVVDVFRLFFAIQGIIVGFLFFIPVWRFPAGIFILPILIASVLLLGYLTDKPLKFLGYLYYISLGAIFVVIAVMVITGLSGNTNLVDWVRANPLILLAAFAFIAAGITKGKGKSFAFFASVGGLALVVGIFLILYGVSPNSVVKKSPSSTHSTTSGPTETLKLSELRTNGGPDTLMVGEGLRITPKNPNRPKPLGAMFVTPDGNKYYFWGNNDPQKENWLINNFGPKKEYLVKLELPRGLMLDDLILELQTASAKQHPRTRTRAKQIIQPRPDNRNKTEEGELPKNLEIIS